MTQKNIPLILAIAFAAFAFGLLTGRAIPNRERPDLSDNDQSLIAPTPRDIAADRGEQVVRRAFQEIREADAQRPSPPVIDGFSYTRLDLDMSGPAPRACLQFSGDLVTDGSVNYVDYIRLTPATKPAVQANGATLCLSGLAFNEDYQVMLRPGLPGADDQLLERGETVLVAFGDKPAYVGFAGNGVILPRFEADGLGLETVNVERLAVSIYRVSDRALATKTIVEGQSTPEDRYSYVYGQENGEDVGVLVYEGALDIEGPRNDAVNTVFALGAALDEIRPGAYFVRLRDASPGADAGRAAQAWRWVIFTDMALTTFSGADGADIFVRSLTSARPVAGVELALIATNNDVLGRTVTNAEGRARFDRALLSGAPPLGPRMIMAYGPQDDFAALDLTRAPLDLSDRGIGGRAAPAFIDAYMYFDRGVYRPAETVHLTALLRDAAGRAVDNRPSTLSIYRPNGTRAFRTRITEYSAGGLSLTYNVPAAAARGAWRVSLEADGVGVIAEGAFSVEDFVPQRLEVQLTLDEETPINAGEQRMADVVGRFLYGAPGGGLDVEAEARLRLDPKPFPAYAGFRFGPIEPRFSERFFTLPAPVTDADGRTAVALTLGDLPVNLGAPMRADLTVGVVEPGGRVVRESARIPVRPDKAYVGLKLAVDSGGFSQGAPADVDAVLLDAAGDAISGDLEWRLVEEDYWFDWYRDNGAWRWRRSYKDIVLNEGATETDEEGRARITQSLETGSYRLTVTDPTSGARSSIRFYVGWTSHAAGADAPDQASIAIPSEPVTPGARTKFVLSAPYDGEALVAIATDRIHQVRRVKVEQGRAEFAIDTNADWGGGFYVLSSIVTPRDVVARPLPRRAMAVGYVPFEMGERALRVSIETPGVARPRAAAPVTIKVDGAAGDEQVMLTLAAVDEGILRLTKFRSPDPFAYVFGKRRLGVEVHDDYSRLLHANLGAPARFGGDQIGGEGLSVVPTKTLAIFNGPVAVNENGEATMTLDLPAFNGELRLMAVVWSAGKLGAAAAPLTVRDAAPALLSLPRFLAPGDAATATLSLDNVEAGAGEFRVRLVAEGSVAADEERLFSLGAGDRVTEKFALTAAGEGIGEILMVVDGPDGYRAEDRFPIEVRTPFFPVSNVSTATLDPGEAFVASDALTRNFAPGSAEVNVSFSRLRGVKPGALLDALYRYPYGCSEQLTSTAMPLLFADVVGRADGREPDRAVRARVQKAINTLLSRQGSDGAFGLWREGDGYATPWLGAYVTDFLQRAKAQGYGVPDEALTRAYEALGAIVRVDRWTPVRYLLRAGYGAEQQAATQQLRLRSSAYAHYVLARAGRADLSDLRYFHDAQMTSMKSPLARAQLGAALAFMGDVARSSSALDAATAALGLEDGIDYYQSPLRDVAGVLAVASEVNRADVVDAVSAQFERRMRAPAMLNTQEKAFVLLAAQALLKAAGPLAIAVDDELIEDVAAPSISPALAELRGDGVAFVNRSNGPIFRTVTASGAPIAPPPATANGFTVVKRIMTRDGTPVALSDVKQNDRLVVVISGQGAQARLHPAIVADLLPAGFEIETVLKPEDGARPSRENAPDGPYRWVGEIARPKIAEARDDRFVAALDVRNERFTLAYVVRAVTPGRYAAPGVVVEDMYRPGVVGRTAAQTLTIGTAE